MQHVSSFVLSMTQYQTAIAVTNTETKISSFVFQVG